MFTLRVRASLAKFAFTAIAISLCQSLIVAQEFAKGWHYITNDKGASLNWQGDFGSNYLSIGTAPMGGPTGEPHAILNYSVWTSQGLEWGFGEIPMSSFTGTADKPGDKLQLNIDTSLLPMPGGFFSRQGNGGLIQLEWVRTADYQIRSSGSTIRSYPCTKTRQNGQSESAAAKVNGFVLGLTVPGNAQYLGSDVSISKYVVVDIEKLECTWSVSAQKSPIGPAMGAQTSNR